MSVEYTMFLRDKPALEGTSLGAMALDVAEYVPRTGDPLEHEAWRGEIRWVIQAYGRIRDYDEWEAFVQRVCKRYRGVLWSEATGDFEELDEEVDDTEDQDDDERDAAELAKLEEMVAEAASSPATMRELKSKQVTDSIYFRVHFSRLLLDRAKKGAALKPWRWAIRYIELRQRSHELATPLSRQRLAKKGELAAAIVAHADAEQARAAERVQRSKTKAQDKARAAFETWLQQRDVDPPMIEKRRRAGEVLAGIPRSTAALAARGKLDEAIADYAKRYGLTKDVARKAVNANIANLPELGDGKTKTKTKASTKAKPK